MLILVANLGSTSFKFRLFRFQGANETELAKGGVERLGTPQARSYVQRGETKRETTGLVADHAAAIETCLALLRDPQVGALASGEQLDAIGFKAVHGGEVTGVQRVDDRVLAALEDFADVAPAHNPVYLAAMRLLMQKLPGVPLVAAFETGFHQTIPAARQAYAVPQEWAKLGVRRYGFHGASHRYIAERLEQLCHEPRDNEGSLRAISCHLGGSSSLCALRGGASMATTMGFSPQSGLPQNNRVGDFDVFALPFLMRKTGKSLQELLKELDSGAGLLGLSGTSNDLRELQAAAAAGDSRAKFAIDTYVEAVRHQLGAMAVHLGEVTAIAFTGGIGENSPGIRAAICANLDYGLNIELDPDLNQDAAGEARISVEGRVEVWTIPTNEELIVARQTRDLLQGR